MATRSKRGRPQPVPPKPKLKRTVAYLDPERLRQLAEIVQHHGSNDSRAISQAITFHHSHLKKEWPDDFS